MSSHHVWSVTINFFGKATSDSQYEFSGNLNSVFETLNEARKEADRVLRWFVENQHGEKLEDTPWTKVVEYFDESSKSWIKASIEIDTAPFYDNPARYPYKPHTQWERLAKGYSRRKKSKKFEARG